MTKRWLVSLLLVVGLTLAPAASPAAEPSDLVVQVHDGNGRPVAEAIVHAGWEVEDDEKIPEDLFVARTNREGRVRLPGLPLDKTLWVLVERQGFAPEVRNLAPGAARTLRIGLRRGSVHTGQVVDELGRPVINAEVELAGEPFDLWVWNGPIFLLDLATIRTRTSSGGEFVFRDLPDGEYSLQARHPDFAPTTPRMLHTRAAGDVGRLVLRRGATLRGRVTDPEGRPLAGVAFWDINEAFAGPGPFPGYPPPRLTTGADGSFAVPHLPPDEDAELFACAPGFIPEWVTPEDPDSWVDVVLRPAARLRGRVLSPSGEPIENATVSATRIEESLDTGCFQIETPCSLGGPVQTDAQGRFELLVDEGRQALEAVAPGLAHWQGRVDWLQAGEVNEGFEIKLERGAP